MTDYNAIAHAYREAKSLPIKQYSEAFTFFHVLTSVAGLVVLDVACGDGYYTRALKRHGASRVLGVNSSHRMITYATREEEAHPLGGRLARLWERLLARLSHPSAYCGFGSPERHA